MSPVRNTHLVIALAGTVAVIGVAPALARPDAYGTPPSASEHLSSFAIKGDGIAKTGAVSFKVKNTARVEHELVVIRTNHKAGYLKLSHGKASEAGSVGEVEVAAGSTRTLKLQLKPGHYALICNLPGHYKSGMHKDFVVR